MVRKIHSSNEDSRRSGLKKKLKKNKRKSASINVHTRFKDSRINRNGNDNGGRGKVEYNCDCCRDPITGKIYIKCATCPDFDLCVDCFSIGVEIHPHENNHPYRVMDNLSFSVLCQDWNAQEELLLLEGIEMFGMNNWNKVAKHIGTKTGSVCNDHYNTFYINSPCFPLPDMSGVMGKNKEELLVMTKEQVDNPAKTVEIDMESVTNNASPKGDDKIHMEDNMYNPKRHEFEIEYDNDAEQLLADLEFNKNDTEDELEIKRRILHIYNRRLDERQRRKDFVIERNLHLPDPFYDSLSPEEKKTCDYYKRFMRFLPKDEFEKLVRDVIESERTLKKINNFKEAQAAGCSTQSQAEKYFEQKRLNDEAISTGSMAGWGVSGFPRAELLSKADERVCVETRMMPRDYMDLLSKISMGVIRGEIKNKSDGYGLCKECDLFKDLDETKFDKIYDVVIKKLGSI